MKTLTRDQELALANLPGPVEIKIAVEYLARESRKLDMGFVADLLKSASMAINEYLSSAPESDIHDTVSDEKVITGRFAEADFFSRASVSELENMLGLEMEDD